MLLPLNCCKQYVYECYVLDFASRLMLLPFRTHRIPTGQTYQRMQLNPEFSSRRWASDRDSMLVTFVNPFKEFQWFQLPIAILYQYRVQVLNTNKLCPCFSYSTHRRTSQSVQPCRPLCFDRQIKRDTSTFGPVLFMSSFVPFFPSSFQLDQSVDRRMLYVMYRTAYASLGWDRSTAPLSLSLPLDPCPTDVCQCLTVLASSFALIWPWEYFLIFSRTTLYNNP